MRRRLLGSAARDIGELRPQLEPRAEALAERAALKLRERGAREAKELRETLVRQRDRVKAELDRHEAEVAQLALDLDAADKRQLEANKRAWRERL
ncbi:MAG: helicase, partial [Gemmatimonadota bacterium]|nr:helicase [Gemmatimonadota bacterium]